MFTKLHIYALSLRKESNSLHRFVQTIHKKMKILVYIVQTAHSIVQTSQIENLFNTLKPLIKSVLQENDMLLQRRHIIVIYE